MRQKLCKEIMIRIISTFGSKMPQVRILSSGPKIGNSQQRIADFIYSLLTKNYLI